MEGLTGLVERAAALMPSLQSLTVSICFVIGLVCAYNSLRGYAAVGDKSLAPAGWSSAGWKGPTFLLVVAICFLSLSSVISAFLVSIFGQSETYAASEVFAYAPELLEPINNEMGRRVVISVVQIIQFIGLVAFTRGIYIANLSALNPHQGFFSKGLTHMIGGVLAMNLVGFLERVEDFTLGH
jgi:hypothetical protein